MIAIGAGGLDVAVAMAGHPYEIACPEVVEVHLAGTLAAPVGAGQGRDPRAAAAAHRARRQEQGLRVHRARHRRPERARARHDRQHDRRAGRHQRGLPARRQHARVAAAPAARGGLRRARAPTTAASYDERVEIDLDELGPLVAKPQNPDNVVPVEEVAGTPIEQVCIGSSVNSAYLDLALPGAVLAEGDGRAGARARDRHRHARLAPDPGGDRRVRRLPPARGGRRADARAGLRPVRGHGPGAALGRQLAAHLQPQLPRPLGHPRGLRSTSARRRWRRCRCSHGEIRDPREHGDPPDAARDAGAEAVRRRPPHLRRRRPRTRPTRSRSRAGRTSRRRPSTRRSRTS